VEVNFGKQIACLTCLLVFIIFTISLEITFESIYFGVVLLIISFVAGFSTSITLSLIHLLFANSSFSQAFVFHLCVLVDPAQVPG
jgi:cytochrome c oxidase assembly factor CtaG